MLWLRHKLSKMLRIKMVDHQWRNYSDKRQRLLRRLSMILKAKDPIRQMSMSERQDYWRKGTSFDKYRTKRGSRNY